MRCSFHFCAPEPAVILPYRAASNGGFIFAERAQQKQSASLHGHLVVAVLNVSY